ncbi:MAG: DegT/DnrJ/EryC1/StrS family aminotransferase, partial [Planctomycetota bacterium]
MQLGTLPTKPAEGPLSQRPAVARKDTSPFGALPFGYPMIGAAEQAAVAEVLRGPTLTQGPRVGQFEEHFARFTGADHAVAVSSCTAALHLAYDALGIGPGDEVV